MEWTVVEDASTRGAWRVEGINFSDEGSVYIAIFSGPDAKARAEEYAEYKYSHHLTQQAA